MRKFKQIFAASLSLLLLGAPASSFANQFSGMDAAAFASNDPPGNFFPGKYFEYKAQFYLKKKDYHEALRLFELSGFWADKIAQYNTGLMYYNGLGVPVDRVNGVAWLGIAAEQQDDLAVKALQLGYASLSREERLQANAIWKQLDAKYGDAASLPRALQRFNVEARSATGSHLGFVGNLQVYETGPGNNPLGESGFGFYRRQDNARDALLDKITGHVTVGAVTALKVSDDAKANASQMPLTDPPATPVQLPPR